MSSPTVALVLGASGVTGTPFTEQLLEAGWTVYGVSRRVPVFKAGSKTARFTHLAVDLHDAVGFRSALRASPGITHVFHCANAGSGAERLRIAANLLDAIEAEAPAFRHINLMQGMKYYGCHLGPFPTPAREDDPRIADNVFYYEEEDLVRRRQEGRSWSWTALRPHSVCGYAAGNPLNLALVLAVYCSLQKALGEPLWFPASPACFRAQFQAIDAELLARAAIHVSTRPSCANTIYNVSNGDPFRWQHLWPQIAGYFGLTAAGPGEQPLARVLERHGGTWAALVRRHRLVPFPIEKAAAWVRGDYAPPNSRFACEYDMTSDTTRFRTFGFTEAIENGAMFRRLFDRYRAERLIP